jgi:hypothetical protein
VTAFPVTDEDIRALRVKLLRALGAAKYPAQVIGSLAGNNNLTVDDVKALVANHGWPDPQEMRRHAFELEGGTTVESRPRTVTSPAKETDPKVEDEGRAILRILTAGEKSEKARTRKLAAKIRDEMNDLRDAVIGERKEREAAAEAAAERTRLETEVKRLEAELAAKRKLLGPKSRMTRTSTTPNGNAAEIRAWAAAHSIACPATGRVPRDVVEAYELSHETATPQGVSA